MTSDALEQDIVARVTGDSGYAIAYALLQLAAAQERTASAIEALGFGDASSSDGVGLLLARTFEQGFQAVDGAIRATIPE